VTAKDKATGKENKITIKANSGLSEAEIQAMVKDAEVHAEEDKKTHELVDARNQCDSIVHSVKKSLGEHGDKISAEEKANIETAIKEAEDALKEGTDKASIEARTEALMTASQKLGEAVNAQQQAAGAGPETSGGGTSGEAKQDDSDVVDAEFTEVKDKK